MKLQQIIEQHWYQKPDPILTIILFPFSLIYELIVAIRSLLFKIGIKRKTKLHVPVVVVGNISVGGAGKTPLTKYLATELQEEGYKVGIILRGYKADNKNARIVSPEDSSELVGDEALIYAQAGLNVAIGIKRVEAGKLILQQFPDTQIILADDGMQHYYLARDMEICVVDSTRIFGNQQMLPMGPLREPLSRIKKVNAVVVNGNHNQSQIIEAVKKYTPTIYWQNLAFESLYNPVTGKTLPADGLNNQDLIVMAAIGNPNRFFHYLDNLGVEFKKVRTFPDHHHYEEKDIPEKYTIITTEKDYTKLAKFKNRNIWVAKVKAELDNDSLLTKIKSLIK